MRRRPALERAATAANGLRPMQCARQPHCSVPSGGPRTNTSSVSPSCCAPSLSPCPVHDSNRSLQFLCLLFLTLLFAFAETCVSEDSPTPQVVRLLQSPPSSFCFDFETGAGGWRLVEQGDEDDESSSKYAKAEQGPPSSSSGQRSEPSKSPNDPRAPKKDPDARGDETASPLLHELPPTARPAPAQNAGGRQAEAEGDATGTSETRDSTPAGHALKLDVAFPQETCIRLKKRVNLSGYNQILLDLLFMSPDDERRPNGAPSPRGDGQQELLIKVMAYVKDSELLWYDAYQEVVVEPGKWSFVSFDISDNSKQWRFKGHRKPWDGYTKQDIQEVGFKFFSDSPLKGSIYVDNIQASRAAPPRGSAEQPAVASVASPPEDAPKKGPQWPQSNAFKPKTRIVGFRVNSQVVGLYEKFEITFNVDKVYSNPYDPDVVDIKAHFISPTGEIATIPAFFYQDYIRDKKRGAETLTPVGKSEWKIRFAPQELGVYRYTIEINEGEAGLDNPVLTTQPRSFEAAPSSNRGYVRISAKDKEYLEFDNGEFFYPIGHNICAPYDVRNAEILGITVMYDEGTFAYDRFLEAMAKNGENVGRVWMTSWSLGIEWTKKYDSRFHDLGRYNLERAWKLDHVLESAEEKGIYLSLTLSTFGHFKVGFEGDWPYNPYNTDNGGFLPVPEAFFTYPEAEKYFQRRLRYIMARWGYSTAIMSWEIFNEIDLADGVRFGKDEKVVNWHRRMLQYMKKIDQGKHLVSSSILYWQHGEPLWSLDEMEYVNAHIFDVELLKALREYYRATAQYSKPRFVTESGSTVWGRSPEVTEDYIHISLWGAYMMPFPGSAMPWWWLFIDDKNLYFHFKALANFAKGEDRREKGLDFGAETATIVDRENISQPIERLGVECLRNDSLAYLWVYDKMLLNPSAERKSPPPQNGAIRLTKMRHGRYSIEFWNTYQGNVIGKSDVTTEDGAMTLPLPPIEKDLACKVKLVD